MIYFDNSATSPVDEEVLEAMLPYLKEEYGNPSSKYYCKAVNARNAVEEARIQVAKLMGANPEEIIFTAGATESTNFVIKGYMDYRRYYGDGKNHIITSVAEHKATLNTCKYLNGDLYSNNDPTVTLFGGKKSVDRGYEASFIDITEIGEILATTVENAIKNNTAMVSVIYVNNEIGTISNISEIAELCVKKGIAIHSDLTQAIGKMAIDVHALGIDFASCSAHKIYGPKGVGAAFLKNDAYGIPPITAFMHMKTIRVVAAVICDSIEHKTKIFSTARGYGEFKGGWEFPGGKIEAGETPQQAVVREIREELDATVRVGDLIDTIEYDYPTFHLSMDCFWCEVASGELKLLEAEAARWLTKEELDSVQWLPADVTLIDKIKSCMS